jgi:NTE family protein
MLGTLLDVFRLRQYFDVITRTREWVAGLQQDAGLLTDAGRALLRLPSGGAGAQNQQPFPPAERYATNVTNGQRIALAATGGSGAMASLVGAARALEEAGLRSSVFSLCSGRHCSGFRWQPGSASRRWRLSPWGCSPRTT